MTHNDQALPTLLSLMRIPSVTGDAKACLQTINRAQAILSQAHVISKVLQLAKQPVLIWGELDLSRTKWLLNSHLDVVPALPAQFIPKVTKDKVWGRGSADTKWASALLLNNAQKWGEIALHQHLTFCLVVDEEVGGASTKALLPEMPNLQGAIFLEPTQEKIVLKAKGIMQVKIVASGKTCHGSRPWEGINAIEKIMHGLATFRMRQPAPLSETKDTTFNFSTIVGGTAINQVPDTAELWCDIRFNPHAETEAIITQLQTCFEGCIATVVKHESAISCDRSTLVVQTLCNAMRQNSHNPLFAFDHGSADARHGTSLGIPSLVFGIKGKGAHSEQEWGSLKSMAKVTRILDTWISLL